jgi:SAM-dependent methyltransferase
VALSRQCRKPTWWLGRLILWTMNLRHSSVTDWGLKQVPLDKHFTMLDVGCGGGRTLDKLAAIASEGKVFGIDYSAASVAAARRTNARWIQAGRADIQQGSVSRLPYADGTFDVVTAIETHYYWPDLAADLREILRTLKPGGRLVIIAETYKGRRFDFLYRPVMKLLRATYLSVSEHRDLFSAAGYSEITVLEERRKGWICVVGRRPL